jgi:glycosyltransferase involved in cell wall biosynthesis
VAAAVGGLPSIVRDGQNGLLVRWRCADAFAERLDALVGDADLRARLARNARRSVERYDWRRIGDEVRGLYQEVSATERRVEACSCF